MIEGRWKIKNLNEIKSKIILKGIKKGEYSSKDIIFTQNNKENLLQQEESKSKIGEERL